MPSSVISAPEYVGCGAEGSFGSSGTVIARIVQSAGSFAASASYGHVSAPLQTPSPSSSRFAHELSFTSATPFELQSPTDAVVRTVECRSKVAPALVLSTSAAAPATMNVTNALVIDPFSLASDRRRGAGGRQASAMSAVRRSPARAPGGPRADA